MKNVCVAGYGAIGPIHARALCRLDDVRLWAVCEPDPERAEKAKRKYGVKVYSDFDEMLQSGEADAVHICTPHYLHKEMAMKALRAGCDVVLEKPASMNRAELEELMVAEAQAKGRVCVMLQNRTNDCIKMLAEIIKKQENTGAFLSINGTVTWLRDEAYYRHDAWRGKWVTEGGGLLINQAIHLIDLMGFLGGKISRVRGSISTKWLDGVIEVEDTADAVFQFQNGTRGCFYATNASVCSTPVQLDVFFEKVHYRYADHCLYEIRDGKFAGVICYDGGDVPGKAVWGDGHSRVIQSFYESAQDSGGYITLKDAENSAKALFAFYESAKNGGGWVTV